MFGRPSHCSAGLTYSSNSSASSAEINALLRAVKKCGRSFPHHPQGDLHASHWRVFPVPVVSRFIDITRDGPNIEHPGVLLSAGDGDEELHPGGLQSLRAD